MRHKLVCILELLWSSSVTCFSTELCPFSLNIHLAVPGWEQGNLIHSTKTREHLLGYHRRVALEIFSILNNWLFTNQIILKTHRFTMRKCLSSMFYTHFPHLLFNEFTISFPQYVLLVGISEWIKAKRSLDSQALGSLILLTLQNQHMKATLYSCVWSYIDWSEWKYIFCILMFKKRIKMMVKMTWITM